MTLNTIVSVLLYEVFIGSILELEIHEWMKLVCKVQEAQKAYEIRSTSRWCQTNELPRVVDCGSVRDIEANVSIEWSKWKKTLKFDHSIDILKLVDIEASVHFWVWK